MNTSNKSQKVVGHSGQRRQDKIGEKLREIYDEVAKEPAPDSFLKLLEEADNAEQGGSTE